MVTVIPQKFNLFAAEVSRLGRNKRAAKIISIG